MRRANKKSFDWYGTKQQFSIRKYHFGAASVLLGMSLAVGAGAQTAQAETTTATTEATTLASSTEVAPSTTTEASATEATTTTVSTEVATTERTVTIAYTVEYQDESGKVVESTVKSIETKTTDKTAIAIVTETATVPADYELVANELTTSTTGVVEGANTKVVFKVVKKVVADTTSTTTSTSSTDTASTSTSSSTVVAQPTTTTATASAPKVAVPTTVEEAKVVLEQVTSEAEVLANEGNRIVATDTTTDTSALKAAAAATKLAATDATSVLQDTVATLDALNTQINAVRTNVEALVLELRKYYPDGEITAVLNTAAGTPAATTLDVTNPNSIYYAQSGVWEIPDSAKAANSGLPVADQQATITEADRNYPDGYIGDQEANRDTFLILNLDTVAGYGDGNNFNDWVNHNYYITFSVSTNAAERASEDVVYAKLVEKTNNGNNVVRTIKLAPGVANNFEELKVLEGDATHKTIYSFVYNVQTANGGTTRTITINNSNGSNKNAFLYSKLEPKRTGENFTTATASVTGSTTQTTSYFVKENADTGRPRELLAKYAQTGGLIGDKFSIAGAIDFDNYELIKSELPSVTSGVLASDYIVGTQTLQLQPDNNEVRVVTITGADGSIQQQLYMLDPNNPDWAKFYKSNMNKATLSDLKDYFKLMFTSEVLKPGTYNTKEGTFSAKFYEADKLVLENTIVQVLDENGNVLGTLSDDKSTITTNAGTTISVASATDSSVIGTDETVYLLNYLKVYKTDTNGNYVDADGNVLDPIKWHVIPPSNPFVKDVYAKESFDTDTVTIATGPLDANSYPEAIWYFGYNYKTANGETRLDDMGPNQGEDTRWDFGGKELGMRNSNIKNEQHARYWYTEKGGVEVYYITSDGKVLTDFTTSNGKTVADKVTIVGHGATDSAYNTASARYSTITAADGTVYYYKQIDTTAKNLHPVVDDKTDTDYRSNEKIDAEKGTIKSDTVKQLTYVYEKAGNVNVHYVDTNGEELQPSVADVTNGKPGTGYDTVLDNKQKEITVNGTVYYLVPAGEYKVGTVGDENNLTVVGNGKATGIDATTGTVDAGVTKNVTYVYQKGGDVIVNYVDQDGNPISGTTDKGTTTESTVTDTSYTKAGTAYNTTDLKPTTITTTDGKVYRLVPAATQGNEDGKVESGVTTEVTYVYQLVEGDVIVHYEDTNGNTIAADVTDTQITATGTDYNTTDNKPEKIVNDKTGEVYYILPKDEVKAGSASETGKVVEGTTEVTYVYEKAGNVVVNYITEDGTVIKDPVTDTPTSPEGTPYDTTDNKPKTITFKGEEYELVRVDGTENGKVVEGETVVTYVYRKVETPAKKVVTNHVDEDGNPIAPQEEGTTPNKSIPGYEFTGKTVTDPDGNTTHIYRKVKKVVTNHVDEEGNPVAPQEDGTTPNKSIPGYEFTGKTITDEDGNTTHIYKKTPTNTVITKHVDEEGNPVAPQEDGTTPNKSIPGYEYVRTVVDVEGNTTHIYRKVSNKPTPPATETPVKPQPATPTADKAKQLPNTGEASSSAGVLGAAMLVAAIALAGKRRRNED
ncbi:TPA: MucBP domain-containing protein [Streptococcus suis]|nr:MucBP domain-containing protein [Streptococcus suis]